MMVINDLLSEIRNIVAILGFIGILVTFDLSVIVLLVFTTFPSLLYELHFSRRMYLWFRRNTGTERKSRYLDYLLSFPEYAKELRLFELGRRLSETYQELRKDLRVERMSLETKRALASLGSEIIATGGIYACYALSVYRTVNGTITLGDMIMYYRALSGGQRTLQQLLSGLSRLYESNLFLSNMYELLALKPRVVEPPDALSIPSPMREGIVFRDVYYRYPGSNKDVLQGINLTIRPGERMPRGYRSYLRINKRISHPRYRMAPAIRVSAYAPDQGSRYCGRWAVRPNRDASSLQ